ncbi:MAG: ATPase domain-containing protein, partial [Alkalispirochaetaceae bacterium]
MPKRTSHYVCNECGHEEPKWLGQCPSCGAWNTLTEVANKKVGTKSGAGSPGRRGAGGGGRSGGDSASSAVKLRTIEAKDGVRRGTGIGELDRVLGGGAMAGATVLIGGEPGIGKSTLMLQAAAELSRSSRVVYISGEESAQQIRLRAERLGASETELELLCETNLQLILDHLSSQRPEVIVVDSIQTIFSD